MKDFDWTNVYWIARDDDGSLFLYDEEPHLHADYKDLYTVHNAFKSYQLPYDLFESITFNNSPKMVRLSFEEIK